MMDLADALLQSEWADASLTCVRPTQTIDHQGFARNTEEQLTFTGIVIPDAGDALARTAEGAYTNARITIHTPFSLSAGNATHDADVVVWQKRRYTVTSVKDYRAFGFVCATGELMPLSG